MTSGGRRSRSGPAADPNSARQQRNAGAGWVELPAEAHVEHVPAWPLPMVPSDAEESMWHDLWGKPQSLEWHRLGLFQQVAFYVQTFQLALDPEASAALRTAVLRMEGDLGISAAGLASLKWRIVEQPGVAQPRHPHTPGTGKKAPDDVQSAGARLRLVARKGA